MGRVGKLRRRQTVRVVAAAILAFVTLGVVPAGAAARTTATRDHSHPRVCAPVRVNLLNVPEHASAPVTLVGPSGATTSFPTSGSTCLSQPGTYHLIAKVLTFTNALGRPWHAYPTVPHGALAVEVQTFSVTATATILPRVLNVSYLDQAPLTTIVLPRSQVRVPSGRFLPAFGALTLAKSSLTSNVRPGDIVVAPISPGLPHGILGAVTGVSSSASGLSLLTRPTTPFRAFSRGTLHLAAVQPAAVVRTLTGLSAPQSRTPHNLSVGCGTNLNVSGSASFQPAASLNLGWSWGPWYAPWQVEISGSFSLSPGVSGQITVSSAAGVNCNVSADLPPITIATVCTEIGCFTFNLLVTASVDGQVGVAFTQSLQEQLSGSVGASFSFGYNGSSFQQSDSLALTGSSNTTGAWRGSVGVGIGPALQVLYGIPDVAGAGPQVGVQDTATLSSTDTGWSIEGGVQASVGFAMEALGFGYTNSIDIPVFNVALASGSWPTQPSAPLSVTASPDPSAPATTVDVNWLPPIWPGPCGISGFTASVGSQSTSVGSSTTSATVAGLTGGTAYTVTVTANTSSCGSSQASTTVTTPVAPPGPPTLTSVVPEYTSAPAALATFTPPSACTGCATVTGYQIAWSGDGTSGTSATTGTSDSFALPAYGTPYSVTVAATSAAGTGPVSNAVTVTPTNTPSAPLNVSAAPGYLATKTYTGPAIKVTWAPPASDGGLPLTTYKITGWGVITQAATVATQVLLPYPAYGTNVVVYVTASNSLGTGPNSPYLQYDEVLPPSSPTDLVLVSSANGTATISWSPPAHNNGAPTTGYEVNWGTRGIWQSEIITSTSATVPLTTPGAYSIMVLAQNRAGDSAPSPAICVTSGTAPPCPPTNLALAQQVGFQTNPVLTWSAPTQFGNSPVASYTITWTGAGSGHLTQPASAGTSASLPLAQKGTYTVLVTATNASGTSEAASFTFPYTGIHLPPP